MQETGRLGQALLIGWLMLLGGEAPPGPRGNVASPALLEWRPLSLARWPRAAPTCGKRLRAYLTRNPGWR
eukprot:5679898-Heterocapsa_arctica.AAC.1